MKAALFALALLTPSVPVHLSGEPTPFIIDNNQILKIECGRYMGTGSYLGGGLVLTAKHVVSASSAPCTTDGKPSTVIETTPGLDYAVLKIAGANMARELIDCSGFHEGESYLATGFALDAPRTVTQRLTASSATDDDPEFKGLTILRGSVTQGMSGGPINDLSTGAMVGIINANTDYGITQVLALPLSATPLCRKA